MCHPLRSCLSTQTVVVDIRARHVQVPTQESNHRHASEIKRSLPSNRKYCKRRWKIEQRISMLKHNLLLSRNSHKRRKKMQFFHKNTDALLRIIIQRAVPMRSLNHNNPTERLNASTRTSDYLWPMSNGVEWKGHTHLTISLKMHHIYNHPYSFSTGDR